MARIYENWIESYVKYASFTEAPSYVHFWVAVSTIAGILGRRVWIDQHTFKWYANHYIFLIGPPDVISKSTTFKMGMRLLKRVQGFEFGPTSGSWQALIKEMQLMETDHDFGDGKIVKTCACTVSVSELGTFFKPKDPDFIDVMVSLWDGDTIDKKLIKDGGSVFIENPLLNLNGCVTPSWVTMNIPEYMLEGGLLSRIILVYGDKIDHPVAYLEDAIPDDIEEEEADLARDLLVMQRLKGPLMLTKDAKEWGREWYNKLKTETHNENEKTRDTITRKQTHVHKLAIILSISESDSLVIKQVHLQRAVEEIEKLSSYRSQVVSSIGKTLESTIAERLLDFVQTKKACKLEEAYRLVHSQLPNGAAFLDIMNGLVKAGYVKEQSLGGEIVVIALRKKE